MLSTGRIIISLAIAAMALPAAAGSWPNLPSRKPSTSQPAPAKASVSQTTDPAGLERYREFRQEETLNQRSAAAPPLFAAAPARMASAKVTGFEFVGGDTGWQPSQHKYVWKAGRLAHSDECDHVIRAAQAPTPAEIDSARNLSPGA